MITAPLDPITLAPSPHHVHHPLRPEIDQFLQRMPKFELHVHLEGSILPRTLLELAQRNGVELPACDVTGVEQLFRYRHFGEFLTVFMEMAKAIVHGEDFERLAYEYGLALAQQHVLYAEVMLSPMQHLLRGLNLHEAICGTMDGFVRARRETGVVVQICLDYGRQYGPDTAWDVLEMVQSIPGCPVVAWSIGGNEIGYPPEPFAEVFAAAKAAGLHLMAHAGEVVGPSSVWGAIDTLHVERVGHGIQSIHDSRLITHLRERDIVLDISPSSNIYTGAVRSWEAHPLRHLYDGGVRITINSDDPTFFRTTITDEYRNIVRYFGFSVDEVCHLVTTSVHASFLAADEKMALLQRVTRELTALRQELGV